MAYEKDSMANLGAAFAVVGLLMEADSLYEAWEDWGLEEAANAAWAFKSAAESLAMGRGRCQTTPLEAHESLLHYWRGRLGWEG